MKSGGFEYSDITPSDSPFQSHQTPFTKAVILPRKSELTLSVISKLGAANVDSASASVDIVHMTLLISLRHCFLRRLLAIWKTPKSTQMDLPFN